VKVGIVQGRLSPPRDQIQAFPWASWQEEFALARSLGFDGIELLVDEDTRNPIWSEEGRRAIRRLADANGREVPSVCAHYFTAHPFFRVSEAGRQRSEDVLGRLIDAASAVGARLVLVPVLEEAEIRTPREADALVRALRRCIPRARANGIRLGLETELPAADAALLVSHVGDDAVGIYYDTGNAAARGYDCAADIRALGALVFGIHLKDRVQHGGTVPLGEGAVDFPAVVRALNEIGYDGMLVLEGAGGPDYLELAARYRRFVEDAAVTAGSMQTA
jgi:L-ribulose-5-phosphate 3-epimerase